VPTADELACSVCRAAMAPFLIGEVRFCFEDFAERADTSAMAPIAETPGKPALEKPALEETAPVDDDRERLRREAEGPNLNEWIARYGAYHLIPWKLWDEAVARHRTRVLSGEFHRPPYRQLFDDEAPLPLSAARESSPSRTTVWPDWTAPEPEYRVGSFREDIDRLEQQKLGGMQEATFAERDADGVPLPGYLERRKVKAEFEAEQAAQEAARKAADALREAAAAEYARPRKRTPKARRKARR
jgi:hypothetical protein